MNPVISALPTPISRLLSHSKEDTERRKRLDELKQNLDSAKIGLCNAITNFNNVVDPGVVDMYIYRIQSAQARYDYILKEIKEFK